jgi:uncharacterized membrane-anchored protein
VDAVQVLERECEPDVLAKKRAKLEGKRAKAFPKVSCSTDIAALLALWGQAREYLPWSVTPVQQPANEGRCCVHW